MYNSIYPVYLVTNKINSKQYVGQTVYTIEHRWYGHVNDSRRRSQTHFHKAIRKYKPENFIIEQIDFIVPTGDIETDGNALDELEKYYIQKYDTFHNGYNSTEGGRSPRGLKHSEKTRAKMKVSRTGQKRSKTQRKRMSDAQRGKSHPQSIVTCDVCGKSGGKTNMKRYHFENCKKKNKGHKQIQVSCLCGVTGGLANMKRYHLHNCISVNNQCINLNIKLYRIPNRTKNNKSA